MPKNPKNPIRWTRRARGLALAGQMAAALALLLLAPAMIR